MNAIEAIETIELAVQEWSFHVERCDVCLVDANRMCYEGQYLADEVVLTRSKIQQPSRAERPAPILTPRRRPILPGVPA